MFDLIGDIHGHAGALKALLERLGYREGSSPRVGAGAPGRSAAAVPAWRHPTRTAVFVGDFVDRGPGIAETLAIVRGMVESGAARAVMGNHEINALAFATPRDDRPEQFCRAHTPRNIAIHAETLSQLDPAARAGALEWFRRLPVALDLGGLRVVHACWDDAALAVIGAVVDRSGGVLTDEAIRSLHREGSAEFAAMEQVLKGPEVPLPPGMTIADNEGHPRRRIRARWFARPSEWTYAALVFPPSARVPAIEIPPALRPTLPLHGASAPPVFFGHYWMPADEAPSLLAPNVACLDWSVARGGALVAYAWHGERTLDPSRLAWVRAAASTPTADRSARTMPA